MIDALVKLETCGWGIFYGSRQAKVLPPVPAEMNGAYRVGLAVRTATALRSRRLVVIHYRDRRSASMDQGWKVWPPPPGLAALSTACQSRIRLTEHGHELARDLIKDEAVIRHSRIEKVLS